VPADRNNADKSIGQPYLAVDAVSLADGAVIANGLPDDLCQTAREVIVVQ
jgi:hypothetical protein